MYSTVASNERPQLLKIADNTSRSTLGNISARAGSGDGEWCTGPLPADRGGA